MTRRFIEEHFPVKEVSTESLREKNIRHGHISTLHVWWARRPLAASRATIYASLIPAPDNDKEITDIKQTIAKLSRWTNPLDPNIIAKAKKSVLAYNKTAPKVLDLFAGGGSIPLEALRLGCDTYATDYNPVSTFIVKATTSIPFQKVGEHTQDVEFGVCGNLKLSEVVKKWSRWCFFEAKKELAKFFPNVTQNNRLVGYIWSRCIPCQNPRCGATVPLLKQFWLANTKKKKVILFPVVKGKNVLFKIIGNNNEKIPSSFDPGKGTICKAKATCLVCGYRMDEKQVKTLFAEGKNSEIMLAVIANSSNKTGKTYTLVTKRDLDAFKNASMGLRKKVAVLKAKYNIDPIPYESLPPTGTLGFRVQRYGMKTWGDLFNDRQKLVIITFMEKIMQAAEKMEGVDNGDMRALPYLGIILDRMVDKNATLSMWAAGRENIGHVFGRQALPMVWDYPEVNPFTSVGWPNMEDWVLRVLEHLSGINAKPAIVKQTSATALPFTDEFFDAVITDPPYYDNVPYSHLSDFFYVWLKRTVGNHFPMLFSTPLTPKSDEVVAYSNRPGGHDTGKGFFEKMLKQSFSEIYRVLKPDGISIIVYAHKSTDGWETLINSILGAGLVVTAAWPVHTEMKERLRSKKSAALLSSIYMVCKKSKKEKVGFYSNIKRDLKSYLAKKLDQLWNEGVSGADFFIASIGSAIEVYGKYDLVMDNKDVPVPVTRLLEDTRTIVTDYAIDKVVRGEFASKISQMTRFYILWRWSHGEAEVPFDDAKKLAQSVGIDLANEWGKGFIKKNKEFVRVVGPDIRNLNDIEDSGEMIDILHRALLLWKKQQGDEAAKFLERNGYKHSEVLRRVAQAISESLSGTRGSKEKEWIDGMFTGLDGAPSLSDGKQTKLY